MTDTIPLRTTMRLKVRSGSPSLSADIASILEAATSLVATGTVTGEPFHGQNLWYVLDGNRFVWSGGCAPAADSSTAADQAAVEEDRPNRSALGDYVPPLFKTVAGVRHPARGRRPNGLEGLIVHFDAYRIRAAGNGPEASDERTVQMIGSGKANGYHYAEISRTGTVFLPEGFDWEEWGYHAGVSKCPATGREGVSRFYVGCEMNNPGKLFTTADPQVLIPWYNAVRTKDGNVVVDANGHATRQSEHDEWYTPAQARQCRSDGNIKPGWYVPYSHAQFEALTNLCLYLARRFSTFRLDRVFGHDEVAPTRKDDPGGALANPAQVMTMAAFRSYLAGKA